VWVVDVYHAGDNLGVWACPAPLLPVVGCRRIVASLPPGKHTKMVITTLFVITFALIALFHTNPCALSLVAASLPRQPGAGNFGGSGLYIPSIGKKSALGVYPCDRVDVAGISDVHTAGRR